MIRIAVTLRSLGEKAGIGVYTRNLLDSLLRIDRRNTYVLILPPGEDSTGYSNRPNVTEHRPTILTKLLWDQVTVPRLAAREGARIIFNPKFTVPLFTGCKTVTVVHGSEWYVHPEFYKPADAFYARVMMRRYLRRADGAVAVSNLAREDLIRLTGVTPGKIKTIFPAVDDRFREKVSEGNREEIRCRYGLPERFILNVGEIYPGKNLGGVLKAFARIRSRLPHKLVIVGGLRWKYKADLQLIQSLNLAGDVRLTGWVPQTDLPAFYQLADCFLYPSHYESFGIALLEAMASGCPVVTSRTGGCREAVGDAGVFVDPTDEGEIAEATWQVLTDEPLRASLVERGRAQSERFRWERSAEETLAFLEATAGP